MAVAVALLGSTGGVFGRTTSQKLTKEVVEVMPECEIKVRLRGAVPKGDLGPTVQPWCVFAHLLG